MDWSLLLGAFMLGLLSSSHCIGMCGGIMGALTMAIPAEAKGRRLRILLGYNLGRVLSYSLMGLLVGAFAHQLAELGAVVWLRWMAGLLLIAMGLYLANWWRGLVYVESAGRYLWAYIQPLGKSLMPVNSLPKAILLGAIWGWLPCGLVYSALVYSMAQANSLASGALMLAFGLGTLPAVLATGLVAQQLMKLMQLRYLRWVFALSIILFGLWTIWGGGHHHGHHTGMDHSGMDHSGMDHTGMDHTGMDHTGMEHAQSSSSAAAQ